MAPQKTLTGMWQKDKEASDSMDPVCELMQLGWVMKTAIKVISKMQIEDTEDSFAFTLKAGGVLDVKECFPRTGEQVEHNRRDKRRGKGRGRLEQTPQGPIVRQGRLRVWEGTIEWDDPHAGTGTDLFVLSEDGDSLDQVSEMDVGGKHLRYVSRYKRIA